jgi:hypothetical protein
MVENQEYAQEELNSLMKKYKENEENRSVFFDEQRKAGVKVGESGEKKLFGITKVEETKADVDVTDSAVTGNSVHNSLFEGPADLAMARKMEAVANAVVTPSENVTATNTE